MCVSINVCVDACVSVRIRLSAFMCANACVRVRTWECVHRCFCPSAGCACLCVRGRADGCVCVIRFGGGLWVLLSKP